MFVPHDDSILVVSDAKLLSSGSKSSFNLKEQLDKSSETNVGISLVGSAALQSCGLLALPVSAQLLLHRVAVVAACSGTSDDFKG